MADLIANIISFLNSFLVTPFSGIISSVTSAANLAFNGLNLPNNYKSFIGSFISNFIPVNYFISTASIIIPIYSLNFIIKILLRLKSFIPTMGH